MKLIELRPQNVLPLYNNGALIYSLGSTSLGSEGIVTISFDYVLVSDRNNVTIFASLSIDESGFLLILLFSLGSTKAKINLIP